MPYSGEVLRRATNHLDRLRSERERTRAAMRERIYQKIPRVAAIDRELRQTVAHIVKATFRDGADPVPAIAEVRRRNQALQAERAELLTTNGYLADCLDDKPICARCGDSGWVGTEMCDCLKVLCTQEQIKELSQILDFGEQSFGQFDFSYYSPEVWSDWGRSPRENMEKVFKICRDYAHNFGRYYFNNLFLSGSTGLGKTFLSACIARAVSENGFSVVYDTAGNILAHFEAVKFYRGDEETREAQEHSRRYLRCDLLILDDLGSELTTPFAQSALYQLVNTRLTSDRRTVVSSNLTMDDVRKRYSPQIASRLEGEYRVLPFFGEDIRMQRKQRL